MTKHSRVFKRVLSGSRVHTCDSGETSSSSHVRSTRVQKIALTAARLPDATTTKLAVKRTELQDSIHSLGRGACHV